MATRSLTWAAGVVDESALAQARALAAALALTVHIDEPGKLFATTERGDVIEWVSADRAEPAHLFAGQQTVLGFGVDDLDNTRDALVAAGFGVIAESTDSAVRFCHVRGPGGDAYGLVQTA